MQERNAIICPPCGENVGLPTKEGQGTNKDFSLLPCFTVLPPQGREMHSGFTLIELLVVILIVAILAAIALPQYQLAVLKSRYMQLEAEGRTIFRAEQLYYLAHGSYTDNFEDLDIQLPGTLNSAKSGISLPTGSCTLLAAYNELFCSLRGSDSVKFFMYWTQRGQARCRCTNQRGCRVCQSVCKLSAPPQVPEGKSHIECVY